MQSAIPKVVHVSAQSTIPTKVMHSHSVPAKPTHTAVTSLTGVKKMNHVNHISIKGSKANSTTGAMAGKNSTKSSNSSASAVKEPKKAVVTNENLAKPTVLNATTAKQAPNESTSATTATQLSSNTAANKNKSHAIPTVKAAPSTPQVLVHRAGKAVTAQTVKEAAARTSTMAALGSQNKAEYQLMSFLSAEMDLQKKKDLPPFDVYLPACLDHTHKLIDNLDGAYTDIQLKSVLIDECWLKKEFPKSHDSSFDNDSACKKFATGLMNARYLELQTGSQEGYEGFCADYYVHIGGNLGQKKAEPKPKKEVKKTSSFPWHFLIVAGVILILFIIILCMVVSKQRAGNA
jgi:hypothetical protein